MKQYYYAVGDEKKGPVSIEELKAAGITPDTLVWYEGLDDWVQAITVAELTDLFGGLTTAPPSIDEVSEDLEAAATAAGDAIDEVGDAAEDLAEVMGDRMSDATDKASDLVEEASAAAGAAASDAFDKARGALSQPSKSMSTRYKGDDALRGAPPKTWLLESILVTILCCLPFGIAGIVNASKVESRFYAGDIAGAQRASAEAAKWTKIGAGVGIAFMVLYFLFMIIVGVGSAAF